MRTLYLMRHSLTDANARRLYCGSTDLPLSEAGRALAGDVRDRLSLPSVDLYTTSGMRRADETLLLLTGRAPDAVLPGLREMDFGRFEMLDYAALCGDPDYRRWIGDETGEVACPGGECANAFRARVLAGGAKLLDLDWDAALAVCHGGSVVRLMQDWFPDEPRDFYRWQPDPCGGWAVRFDNQTPVGYERM